MAVVNGVGECIVMAFLPQNENRRETPVYRACAGVCTGVIIFWRQLV
jgi:hypothetical protein